MIRVPDDARPVLCESTSRGGPETARTVVVGTNDVEAEFDTVVVLDTSVVGEASVVDAARDTEVLDVPVVSFGVVVGTLDCSGNVVLVANDVSNSALSTVLLDC